VADFVYRQLRNVRDRAHRCVSDQVLDHPAAQELFSAASIGQAAQSRTNQRQSSNAAGSAPAAADCGRRQAADQLGGLNGQTGCKIRQDQGARRRPSFSILRNRAQTPNDLI
jgi:hypothetical protein